MMDGLLDLNNDGRFFPELFQLVKLALAGRENVHDDARVIHQHPAGLGCSFAAARLGVAGLQRVLFDPVGNGLELPFAGSRAHDEVVDVRRELAQIEQGNIFAQFVFNRVDDMVSQF